MTSDSTQFNSENSNKKDKEFICGVIEGFYGRPWTTEQRKDLFRKYVIELNWQYFFSLQESMHNISI